MSKQPKPDCAVCGKTAERIKKMTQQFDWEFSHVDCPNRRKCWSNGTGPAAYSKPESPSNPFDKHFDNPETAEP